MIKRVVTEADLMPDGWVCEACGGPFHASDVAWGRFHGNVLGDFVCETCKDRPLVGNGDLVARQVYLRGHALGYGFRAPDYPAVIKSARYPTEDPR